MSRKMPSNGLQLESATLRGSAFGPIGIGALVVAFVFFGIGEMIAGAVAGVVGAGASLKLLTSSAGENSDD
jgi:hypothetical protein